MKTTINIQIDIMDKIMRAASKRGISHTRMVIMLLKQVMANMPHQAVIGSLVRYQERLGPEAWHPFHITYKPDEYEYVQDLKKVLKMSVSNILAYAVKTYLKRNRRLKLTRNPNQSDKYRFQNYVIARVVKAGVIMWKIIWGFPPNIEEFI